MKTASPRPCTIFSRLYSLTPELQTAVFGGGFWGVLVDFSPVRHTPEKPKQVPGTSRLESGAGDEADAKLMMSRPTTSRLTGTRRRTWMRNVAPSGR